jgi:hypothetical protein
MEDVRNLLEELHRWSDHTGVAPIKAWGGYALCRDGKPPSREKVATQIKAGVSSFWLALADHANTYFIVGGKVRALGSIGRSEGAFGSAALGSGAQIWALRA